MSLLLGRPTRSLCALVAFASIATSQVSLRVHEGEDSGFQDGDRFGAVVAALGDVDSDGFIDYGVTALSPSGGVVTIYSGWSGAPLRVHSGPTGAVEFGNAICSLGDVNGDGHDDIAIAAWMADLGPAGFSQDAGCVSIYSGIDGSVLVDGSLMAELRGDDEGDRFGAAMVSLGGHDGERWFAVSAVDDDDRGSSSGSVRILSIASDLTLTRYDDLYGNSAGDRFGTSLAACDVNNETTAGLIVGAPLADTAGGVNAGRVYFYELANESYGQPVAWFSGEAAGDNFGCSVAGLSSWSGEPLGVIVVGADSTDGGGVSSGSVHVFSVLTGQELISWDGGAAGDNMGAAVANAGDVDSDGHPDLLAGAPGNDGVGAPNRGLMSVFSGDGGALLLEQAGEEAFGRLGSSVAGLGRIDFDGYSDFATGTDGASNVSGKVWVLTQHENEPPTILADVVTTDEDVPVSFDPFSNDSDHDGYLVYPTVDLTSLPAHGSVTIDPVTFAFTYSPDLNWFGDDSFSYTIEDDDGALGGPGEVLVHVLDVNDPPIAWADVVTTDEDTAVTIGVLVNDIDVDGVLDLTSVELVSLPSNGVALVDPVTGQVTYSPDENWFGEDSFTYFMRDDDGDVSNLAKCDVFVLDVNDLPVAQDDAVSTFQKFPTPIDVLANDADIDGTIDASGITILAQPAGGTATVDVALGVVIYLGGDSFVGVDGFSYSVADDDGGVSNVVVVTVTVVEDCNHNQSWDTDDIAFGLSADCNATGVPDECELADNDCNSNGVPDDCEWDCDRNGTPDDCDISASYNSDCNSDGVLDDCQIDCNGNGAPDECDLALGVSVDCDADGLPDECASARWIDPAAADCNGDGSWSAPFCSLQDAIFSSGAGDVLLAKPGTYHERVDFGGRALVLRAAAPAGAGVTVIEGDGSGPVVLFQAGESRNSVLEGFTITGGIGAGGQAGGVGISSSSPTLRACWVMGNSSSDFGGGASTRNGANPLFFDCLFEGNHSDRNGGGLFVDNGSVELARCRFIGNTAGDSGGGMSGRNGAQGDVYRCLFVENTSFGSDGGGAFLDGVALAVRNCEFNSNSSGALGGGAFVRNSNATTTFDECSFEGNSSGTHGGALAFDAASVVLRDSVLNQNTAGLRGGGLYVVNAGQIQLRGNTHTYNTCGTFGGGMFLSAQGGSIERCTSSGNVAGIAGGGAYLVEHSTPKLESCVLWGDSPDEVRVEITPGGGGPLTPVSFPDVVHYSCIEGGWPVGPGNIGTAPMFRDPVGGDFGLSFGSPCIDAGNPGLSNDADGSRADMGAHPYQGADYIDVLSFNFGDSEGLEPVLLATNPWSLMAAATNHWTSLRDRAFLTRLDRLADFIAEEDPDVVCIQGLVSASTSPIGDVLTGASTQPGELAFDQVAALMDRLVERSASYSLEGEHVEYLFEVPVLTCAGYADVQLKGSMITLTKGGAGVAVGSAFATQLTGSLGGLGPVSTSLGYLDYTSDEGFRLIQTRLDASPSVSLQGAQASELVSSLGNPATLVGDFASVPGSSVYNVFAGLSFADAWLAFGRGLGATCCQAEDLMNANSSLSDRVDWAVSNDLLWSVRDVRVFGGSAGDRSSSSHWVSTHAGLISRYGTN